MIDFLGILLIVVFVSMVGATQGNKRKWEEIKKRIMSIPGLQDSVRTSQPPATRTLDTVKSVKAAPKQLWEMHDSPEGASLGEGPKKPAAMTPRIEKTSGNQAKPEKKQIARTQPAAYILAPFVMTDANNLVRAIVMSEILGKPKALQKK